MELDTKCHRSTTIMDQEDKEIIEKNIFYFLHSKKVLSLDTYQTCERTFGGNDGIKKELSGQIENRSVT